MQCRIHQTVLNAAPLLSNACAMQETPDTAEALACVPSLVLEDVSS